MRADAGAPSLMDPLPRTSAPRWSTPGCASAESGRTRCSVQCVHHTLSAMTTRSVLISGAGIAGPALASWLTRRGIAVTVVERAPAPRPGGQAVDLRGAGRTVADRMGLLDEIRAVSLEQKGIAWVRADGSIAARMPVDAFGGEGIVSEIEVLRGDLADVLHRATVASTEYVFGDSITGLDGDGDGVTVTFEHAPPRRFDLVVGADGSHSVVRALAFGPEADCTRPLGLYG